MTSGFGPPGGAESQRHLQDLLADSPSSPRPLAQALSEQNSELVPGTAKQQLAAAWSSRCHACENLDGLQSCAVRQYRNL